LGSSHEYSLVDVSASLTNKDAIGKACHATHVMVAIYAEFIVRVLNQQVLQVIFKLLVLRKT
jgi:hypothetical protein